MKTCQKRLARKAGCDAIKSTQPVTAFELFDFLEDRSHAQMPFSHAAADDLLTVLVLLDLNEGKLKKT